MKGDWTPERHQGDGKDGNQSPRHPSQLQKSCKVLRGKVLQRVCDAQICSENDAGQVFPGGAGMDGSSLWKQWVRHHPDSKKMHGKAAQWRGNGESIREAVKPACLVWQR